MSSNYEGIRQALRDRAKADFVKRAADNEVYVVEQRHFSDNDLCKLWRCGAKRTAYHFNVLSSPGTLTVHGDMGVYVWQREYDMLTFTDEAIKDLDYFTEKLVCGTKVRHTMDEMVDEWLANDIRQQAADVGVTWDQVCKQSLTRLKGHWRDEHDVESLLRLYNESVFWDLLGFDSMPDLTYYSYQYLWTIEGLRWFLAQLKQGKVIKPADLPELSERSCIARAVESAEQVCAKFGISGVLKFADATTLTTSALPVVDMTGHHWYADINLDSLGSGVVRVFDTPEHYKNQGLSGSGTARTIDYTGPGEPVPSITAPLDAVVLADGSLQSLFVGKDCSVIVAYWNGYDCGPSLVALDSELQLSEDELCRDV